MEKDRDYMLGHKASLHKFKVTEIISNIFPDHSGLNLDVNNRRKSGKCTSTQN